MTDSTANSPYPEPPHVDAETEDQREDAIQGGKPKKNFKNVIYIVLLLGIVLAMFSGLLTKENKTNKEAKPVEIDTTRQNEPKSILKELEEKKAERAAAPIPVEERAFPQGGVSSEYASADQSAAANVNSAATTAAQAKQKDRDEKTARVDAVLSSPMEPQGVEFGGTDLPKASPVSDQTPEQVALQRMIDEEQRKAAEPFKFPPGYGGGEKSATPAVPPNVAFLQRAVDQNTDDTVALKRARSGLSLYQGSIVRAVLIKGINSDLPGEITARVVSDVYDSISGQRLVVPKGSVLLGSYASQPSIGQSRMLVAMTRMILPNGQYVSLMGAPASDISGYSGLESNVNNHFFKMFGTSLIVGAMTLLLPKDSQSASTVTDAAGNKTNSGTILAQSLQSTVQILADRNKVIGPTLTVAQGELFTFSVAKDMLLAEYVR